MKPTQFRTWLLLGVVAAAVGCGTGSGGATGGQNFGGNAGTAAGGTGGTGGKGGNTSTTGQGGATGTGGGANGGQGAGGAAGGVPMGGKSVGGSAGSAGAQSGGGSGAGGAGGVPATGGHAGGAGGVPATGGQGPGGTNAGGSTGTGGSATGGSVTGGKAAGGSAGNGGNTAGGGGATGGNSGSGGSAAGGASGTGGKTGNADASTAGYHPCPTDGTACKIMPFGDSITDGYNADTPGGYRVELFRLAHSAGKNITFVGSGYNGPDTVDGAPFPHNHEGHSGWTIAPEGSRSGISTLVSTVMPKYTPDIVLLMIGTNDAIDNYDMANAPTRLTALIDSIYAQLPNILIVVAEPIPSRGDASKGDDTALSDRIKAYNGTLPAVVKAQTDAGKHMLLVDMFTPFNPTKTSLLEDQWHPNLAGYVLLGTQWYSALQSLL